MRSKRVTNLQPTIASGALQQCSRAALRVAAMVRIGYPRTSRTAGAAGARTGTAALLGHRPVHALLPCRQWLRRHSVRVCLGVDRAHAAVPIPTGGGYPIRLLVELN